MLYAVYPKKTQKSIIFCYDKSNNYYLFDSEKKLDIHNFKLVYELLDKSKKGAISKEFFIFTNGPILINHKIRSIFDEEEKKGFVQFFDIDILNFDEQNIFFAMHIIHQENITDMDSSLYELDDDEYDFEYQVLKNKFDWDLSIAKAKEVPFQVVINEDIKNRFIDHNIKGINLYRTIDSYNDKNSDFIKL